MEFCARIGASLPTEAEWEFACRAGTQTTFAFGDSLSPKDARFFSRTDNPQRQPWSVRSGSPNAFGFYNMHGNGWEPCLDYYDPEYYSLSEGVRLDPVRGESESGMRVWRGGSCEYGTFYCRSAYRSAYFPSTRFNWVGCRPCWRERAVPSELFEEPEPEKPPFSMAVTAVTVAPDGGAEIHLTLKNEDDNEFGELHACLAAPWRISVEREGPHNDLVQERRVYHTDCLRSFTLPAGFEMSWSEMLRRRNLIQRRLRLGETVVCRVQINLRVDPEKDRSRKYRIDLDQTLTVGARETGESPGDSPEPD